MPKTKELSDQHCYVFVTGGVMSSLGKGLTVASLAAVLEARGVLVSTIKLDPYINLDSGMMNPFQHGEVFVTQDGKETDLDLGHYERFLSSTMRHYHCYTAGQIYNAVISAERRGAYDGATVQVIPHITDQIKNAIYEHQAHVKPKKGQACISLVEIGGTIGDIECQPFLEAIRQIRLAVGMQRSIFMHLTLVPWINTSGEFKTKLTQHSVKEMRSIGLQPDILLCRSDRVVDEYAREKIALFTNVESKSVISVPDLESIYYLPEHLCDEKVDSLVMEKFQMPRTTKPKLDRWRKVSEQVRALTKTKKKVEVAIVGKYVDLVDSYMSLNEALKHASLQQGVHLSLRYVASSQLTKGAKEHLADCDAILVPGGFGVRGAEGMIAAANYARTEKIPFLGICMGMQIAVIEYARNVAKLNGAHSTEFNGKTPHPVIGLIDEWLDKPEHRYEGSMRLGEQGCSVVEKSMVHKIYGKKTIQERHRHRYECNNVYVERLEKAGLKFVAWSQDELALAEMIEIDNHPWYVACQFHPEFKSKPWQPHPLFVSYITAANERAASRK